MDLVAGHIENFETNKQQIIIKKNETKKTSLIGNFINSFGKLNILKDMTYLVFAFLMTKYVMSENANIVSYIAIGILFLNMQQAILKYIIEKNI